MDLPDAAKHRDRGLHEGIQSTPPVRPLRLSGLCRDPEQPDESLGSFVNKADTAFRSLPASPGTSHLEGRLPAYPSH